MCSHRRYDYNELVDEGAWLGCEPAALYDSNELELSGEVYGTGSHLDTARPTVRPQSVSPEDVDHETPPQYHYPDPTEIQPQHPYHSWNTQQSRGLHNDVDRLQTDPRLNATPSAANGREHEIVQEDEGDWQVAKSKPKERRQNPEARCRKRLGSPRQERQNCPAIKPRSSLAKIGSTSGNYDTISEFVSNKEDPFRPQQGGAQLTMPLEPPEGDTEVAASQSTTLVDSVLTVNGRRYYCRRPNCRSKKGLWARRSDRNKHENDHGPFICRVKTCRHSFGSQKSLDEHWMSRHGAGPDPRQNCLHPGCSETFARKDGQDRHVRKFHPELATFLGPRQVHAGASSTTSSQTLVAQAPTRSQKSGLPFPPATDKLPRTASFEEFPPLATSTQRAQTGR